MSNLLSIELCSSDSSTSPSFVCMSDEEFEAFCEKEFPTSSTPVLSSPSLVDEVEKL